ncbi:MAG: type IV pilus biogenesis/stability protein PilW [Burkholderiales bacterium]
MNRMILAGLTVFIVLAGCAGGPIMDTTTPQPTQSTTSDSDADARGRARIHTELAAGYLDLKNMAIALEEAGIAQRADPTYGPAYNVAAMIYAELKNDALAEQNFQQALRINRQDPDANNNYGAFLCQRKREAEGIRYFMAAVSDPLYQQPDRSYVNAGLCARRRGDMAEAEGYFRGALKFQPNQIQALYQLADMAYVRANYPDARLHLQRLAPVSSGSPEILWLILRTERRLGGGNTMDSVAHQLRTNFPASKEAQALAAGQFE